MKFDQNDNIPFWVIVDILVLSCLITQLLLSVQYYNYDFMKDSYIVSIIDNWKLQPILNITDETPQASPHVFGEFEGIIEGCSCIGINSGLLNRDARNKVVLYECMSKMMSVSCKEVSYSESKSITKWRNKEANIKKYNETYYYYLLNSVKEGESCKENFKPCGLLDSLNQIMCINKDLHCPINDIKIDNVPSHASYQTIELQNYKSKSYYLHYTNQAINKHIISLLKLSEENICANEDEIFTQYDQYVLNINYEKFTKECQTKLDNNPYDSRYNQIDLIDKTTLLKENNIYTYVSNLPGYPLNSLQANIGLYSRSFIGFDKECVVTKGMNISSLQKLLKKPELIGGFNFGRLIAVSLTLLYHIVYWIGSIKLRYKMLSYHNIFQGVMIVLHFIIGGLGVTIYIFYATLSLDYSCNEKYVKFNLDLLQMKVLNNQKWNIVAFALSYTSILLYFFDAVINLCKCKKGNEVKNKGSSKDEFKSDLASEKNRMIKQPISISMNESEQNLLRCKTSNILFNPQSILFVLMYLYIKLAFTCYINKQQI